MVSTSTTIGTAYSAMTAGSTSIPTETKKMAPKRFFTGSTSLIILSASTVSASMLPITNAPNALLKPTSDDTTAMRKHSPRATMSSVSSLISFLMRRNSIGMRNMPTTNQSIRKNSMRATMPSISPPSGLLPWARADSITIRTMASTSSRMSTLITNPANLCCRRPMSSNAL